MPDAGENFFDGFLLSFYFFFTLFELFFLYFFALFFLLPGLCFFILSTFPYLFTFIILKFINTEITIYYKFSCIPDKWNWNWKTKAISSTLMFF
jgi:hypothetical protein